MKVIDLLNKIANGEGVPKKIRIDHWCYKFEWVEHLDNYYDNSEDIDLMSALSMSKEELNYGVKIIEEEQDIEKLKWDDKSKYEYAKKTNEMLMHRTEQLKKALNEVIDTLNELKKNER